LIEFDASYFDGRTTARHDVRVRAVAESLHIVGEGVNLEVPLGQASLDSPIPGMHRMIRLPGEAALHVRDTPELDALFPRAHRMESWVHALERRWRTALAGLVVVAAFSAWCVIYGLPLAAKVAAGYVSPELEAQLGEQALAAIERAFCVPSKLDDTNRETLRAVFDTVTAGQGDGVHYRLEVRACPRIGANAFALPGGTIVVTDELDALAQTDGQLAAVLAHEVGHVRYRHGLRGALQAAGLAALIAAVTGDASAAVTLAVLLPTTILQSGYSRDFEDEADSYAFSRLKEIGRSPKDFAEIIGRLEAFHASKEGSGGGASGGGSIDYLSTHPATKRRIERALANP